jgi:hypothetical protein
MHPPLLEAYNDTDHWLHVMETLFVEAIADAGFEPVRPLAQGSHLIHGRIIEQLSKADMVLCDLSSHNPNVFFELGVRTSLNLPIALVRDERTDLPFDTSGINTHMYLSSLNAWEIGAERERLMQHIVDSVSACGGENPLWRQFGLSIRAYEPHALETPLEAKVDLIAEHVLRLRSELGADRHTEIRTSVLGDLYFHDKTIGREFELFAAAAERWAVTHGIEMEIAQLGPRAAYIEAIEDLAPKHRARLRELGSKYGVTVVPFTDLAPTSDSDEPN